MIHVELEFNICYKKIRWPGSVDLKPNTASNVISRYFNDVNASGMVVQWGRAKVIM